MQNSLTDLNNHLFLELERLNDEEINQDNLQFELQRAKGISQVADKILHTASVLLDAKKHFDTMGDSYEDIPKMLRIEQKINS